MQFLGSTKKDIWEAYKEVKQELDKINKPTENTIEKAKNEKIVNSISNSNAINVETVENTLKELVTKISTLKSQYDDIVTAISSKKDELKEVHDIEVSANDLVALTAAKEKLIEITEKKSEETIKRADDYYNERICATAKSIESTKLAQQREVEVYEYETARKRKKEEDAVEDLLEVKKRSLDEREKKIIERENNASENEKKLIESISKINELEKSIQAKIDAAIEETKDKSQRSATFASNMIKATTDANMKIAEAKIENLELRVTELQKQLEKANEFVVKANLQVSEMAQSALKAQGDVHTISKISEIAAGGQKK